MNNRYPEIRREIPLKKPLTPYINPQQLNETTDRTGRTLLSLQNEEGYWWFTLEANETIGAGFIQLMHFLGEVDEKIEKGLVQRILKEQREDGTWGLYFGAAGDLSTTVECYFSLLLAGFSKEDPALQKARAFILNQGGLTRIRIFSRIHLALFDLVDWKECPVMPPEMILLPPWAPLNIYHFSSWARASIVPLLVVLNRRPTVKNHGIDLEELYTEPRGARKWRHSKETNPLSIERLFLLAEKGFKYFGKIPFRPWRGYALNKAIDWVWEHIQKTEDIYPALAYGAMAFKAFGYENNSKQIQTTLSALKSFQQPYASSTLPPLPNKNGEDQETVIHQQCCISPVWDTPWALTALIESGKLPKEDPRLLKAARWLLSKEVREPHGDWSIQNPGGKPGGWAFEFKNEYYPDVDDTIQVLHVLRHAALPSEEKQPAIERGLAWIRSMQNDDGGWGAFDKNNDLEWVNKIPFSDHGACLDPSTPDITARAVELFLEFGVSPEERMIGKAVKFLKKSQKKWGGWLGRWGVNYIYGTWAVLTALASFSKNPLPKQTKKGVEWLLSVQGEDGGFSESPESYVTKTFMPYPESVPSQTAWGVMGLIAAGERESLAAQQGIKFLIDQCKLGMWNENYFTGTGFPGHFYIRYHGYRYYFPLLALARFARSCR